MAHDADDVAKVLAYGRRSGHPGHLPRRRHQPQRPGAERRNPGRRPPPLRRRRGRGRGSAGAGQAGDDPRPRQPRPRPARAQARARPGEHRDRHRRRGRRQQLRRHALRDDQGLLLDRALADLRPALGDDDRHRRGRRGRALRRGRAGAGRRAGGDPRRDPRRRGAERADPRQVRDQEHDRLPALRLPRRRRAAGDLPSPPRRLGGDPRLRRRGGLRDGAVAVADDHRLDPLSRHRRGDRPGPRLRRSGGDRGRADGRAGADHRRLEHGRRPGGVERAAARVGGRSWSSSAPRASRSSTTTSPGPARSSPPTRRSARSPSPATPRRSSSPGGCGRACTV